MVLQESFGWLNSRLFYFDVEDELYGPDEDESEDWVLKDDSIIKRVKVGDVFKVGQKSVYAYDMTNGWQAEIEVERAISGRDAKPFAVCVGGENVGPNECVDPDTYQRELRAEKRRASREAVLVEPDIFDLAWLNSQIASFDVTLPEWSRGKGIARWPALP